MITLKLNYSNGKYYIRIKSVGDPKLKSLLNKFQIEQCPLVIADKSCVSKAFPFQDDIEIPMDEYTSFSFKTLFGDYIKYKSKQYYYKIGLNGFINEKNLLYLSLAVFYQDSPNNIKTLFEAYYPNNNNNKVNNISKSEMPLSQNINTQERKKRYSSSVPYKDIKNPINEINYSLSNIKDGDYLSQSITSKIFGLKNLGNTCFLNSALQILLHSPLFIKRFLDDFLKLNQKYNKNTVTYEFYNLIMEINSSNSSVFSPGKFISSFINKCNLFSLGQQSDSQMFYRNLLNIIEKEIGPQNTCIRNTFVGEIYNEITYCCTSCFCRKKEKKNSKQIFYDIFAYPLKEKSEIANMINIAYENKKQPSSQKCECGYYLELGRQAEIQPNEYLSVNIQKGQLDNRTLKNNLITVTNLKIKTNIYEAYAINFHSGISIDSGHYYR